MAITERERSRTRPARPRPVEPLHDGRPPQPPARGDWRSAVVTASGLNLLAGIWLIIAPFVLGYRSGDPVWNDVVFGAIVALIALVRISGAYRATELSWVNALIGVWIFVSAFWLDQSSTAAVNDLILGAIVFLLGLASASASEEANAWYRR
jgi:SPW repeat